MHGLTAALVLVQLALIAANTRVHGAHPILSEALIQAHLSVGVLAFAVLGARLAARAMVRQPAWPDETPKAAQYAARLVHAGLYLALIALGISGYVKLAALGFEMEFLGLATLPPLPHDPDLAQTARTAHELAAMSLGLLLALHIGAALLHPWLFGGTVLRRML